VPLLKLLREYEVERLALRVLRYFENHPRRAAGAAVGVLVVW